MSTAASKTLSITWSLIIRRLENVWVNTDVVRLFPFQNFTLSESYMEKRLLSSYFKRIAFQVKTIFCVSFSSDVSVTTDGDFMMFSVHCWR